MPMLRRCRLLALLSGLAAAAALRCPAAQAPAPAPEEIPFPIQESELQRRDVERARTFPWAAAAPTTPQPGAARAATPQVDNAMIDVSGGDVEISATGPFSRVESVPIRPGETPRKADPGRLKPGKETKEILSLEGDVEIAQFGTGSVLRGRQVSVQRDLDSGDMDWLLASGNVEAVMKERSARGGKLEYETQFGPPVKITDQGGREREIGRPILVHRVSVEGDKAARQPATMWAGEDVIQAAKFVMDLRADTFRALEGPRVVVRVPGAAAGSEAKPGAKNPMFPGLSLKPGAKVALSCDGDLVYEGFSGRVLLSRSVAVRQEDLTLRADNLVLQLEHAEGPGGAGVFAGTLRHLEGSGRIEIETATQLVLCDQLRYDLKDELLLLEMEKPDARVCIYFKDAGSPDHARQFLHAHHHIAVDTRTQSITDRADLPPARMGIESFLEKDGAPRPIPRQRPVRPGARQ
jgi:hypothetical protein